MARFDVGDRVYIRTKKCPGVVYSVLGLSAGVEFEQPDGEARRRWFPLEDLERAVDDDLAVSTFAPLEQLPPANPKQAYGDKKPRLSLNPLSAQIAQWEAQFDGMLKYGEVNWRENPVEAMTYVDAALRHLRLYENGEKFARDTAVQNLGAVMACCAILIDAELHGTLIDNRNYSQQTCDLLHERGEAMVKHLRAAQAKRADAA